MPEVSEAAVPTLTPSFLKQHLDAAHDHESFGRSVYAGVLSKAIQHLNGVSDQTNEVVIQSEFRITPTPDGCIVVWSDVCQCSVKACGRMVLD